MLNTAIVGLGWWGRTLVKAANDFGAPIRFVRGVTLEPDTVREPWLNLTWGAMAIVTVVALSGMVIAGSNAYPSGVTSRPVASRFMPCPECGGSVERAERVITPVNSTHRVVVMAIERGKLQHLFFDNRVLWNHRAMAAILGVILKLPPVKQAMASRQMKSRYLEALIARLVERDEVYLGSYEGWYDEGQEEFVTESAARESEYKSPVNGRPVRFAPCMPGARPTISKDEPVAPNEGTGLAK